MVQRCRGLGFDFETRALFRVGGDLLWQKFDRDLAFEFGIFGFVHHAHAAFTKLFGDFVVEYGFVDHIYHHIKFILKPDFVFPAALSSFPATGARAFAQPPATSAAAPYRSPAKAR